MSKTQRPGGRSTKKQRPLPVKTVEEKEGTRGKEEVDGGKHPESGGQEKGKGVRQRYRREGGNYLNTPGCTVRAAVTSHHRGHSSGSLSLYHHTRTTRALNDLFLNPEEFQLTALNHEPS